MIGFRPRDVDDMSLFQLGACIDGWAEANSGARKGLDDETFDELAAMLDAAVGG